MRHGEMWMRKINEQTGGHDLLQKAVDWMFPLTVEWFGLPDDLKRHTVQLDYGFKGSSNDQLRQIWMSTAVPFLQELQLDIPAHYDEQQGKYILDFPFPCRFNSDEKRWYFEEGEISWQDVLERWKGRGPKNLEFVDAIQRGKKELNSMLAA